MDGKSGLQTKNAPPKPVFSLSQPGLLQRTCECGGVPGLTGECEECSSKQLSGQRGTNAPAAPNSSPNNPSIAPIQPAKLGGYSFGNLAIAPKERFGVQAKLAIGQPGDRYEQEADRVADQVMRMLPEPGSPMSGFASLLRPPAIQQSIAKEEKKKEEETLQTKPLAESITPLVQRQTQPTEEEKKKEEETLQTKTASGGTPTASLRVMRNGDGNNNGIAIVNQEIEQRIQQERSSGNSLSETIRSPMEQAFGVDFSSVKVHNNDTADKLNRSLSARAFTTGQDIFFKKGEYNPTSKRGQGLLAHELTHVVQQGGAALQRKPRLGQSEPSSVLRHLQTMQQQPGFDTSLYRKEISNFQQTHSTEQIMAKQEQILRQPEGVNVHQKDNSQSLRRCGGPAPAPVPAPAPAPAPPLSFSSASFSAGTGGAITATPAGATVTIKSAAYSPSGEVNVSGGTDAEAQDWEAGFIQTMRSSNDKAHYLGSKKDKLFTISIPSPRRDALVKGGEPWYDPNNTNGTGKDAFTKTNSSVKVTLWDKPTFPAPWDTPDKKGKLDYTEGKDTFTAWMIARKKTSPNTIHYINWTSWEVDYGATFNYASKGVKTVKNITGQTKNIGSGAGKGAETPVLSGTIANDSFVYTWS